MSLTPSKLLTTKQLPALTGLSRSFFEKGRIYGYGPRFIRIKSGRRAGKILYRPEDIEVWLTSHQHNPEAANRCATGHRLLALAEPGSAALSRSA